MTPDPRRAAAPLSPDVVLAALAAAGCPWREVECVASTGSTNGDLLVRAAAGASEGLVRVSDEQTSGRGRLDRTWQAPPGTALTFSVLLRPVEVDIARWSWLPLLAGVAVCDAVRSLTGLPVGLKWPNDLVLGAAEPRKLGGILCEVTGSGAGAAAVVGVGVNVSTAAADLPVPTATSLALAGRTVDRVELLAACLTELAAGLTAWRGTGGDSAVALRPAYLARCVTLGRRVRVSLPNGDLTDVATDVDPDGRLVVGGTAVAAGDVTHVRTA